MKVAEKYNNPTLNLALDTIEKNKQALIFANTKRSAEKTAEDIAKKRKIETDELNQLSEKILKALSKPTKQCQRLAYCVKKGTAFHHAGLTQKQRSIIEDNFRKGLIKIIAATPTLAMGVDLPAFRSIIKDLRRFGRRGLQYIPVLEYLQMAGRAGRPSFDKFGEAIIISQTEAQKDELTEKYINGEPEEIYSKLAVEPVLRTYLLSLISANFVRTKKQIMNFFEDTFWAYQFKDMPKLEAIIERMLVLLVDFEFLVSSKDEFATADELDDVKYRATTLGKRVAELYIDPLTAHNFINALRRSTQRHILPMSFLQMVCFTLELRPLLRVKVKEYEDIQEQLAIIEDSMITYEPTLFDAEYDEYLNSVKTALFLNDWIEENNEEFLLEKYSIRPGEIRVKIDIADWLLYSAAEMCKLLQFKNITKEIVKLRIRLKYGVREELLPLLKLRQVGRVRARSLYQNGIKSIKEIKHTNVTKLAAIIKSRKVAENIKEQLGQKVEKVKQKKRKGQKNVKDF